MFTNRIRLAIDIEDPATPVVNLLDPQSRAPMLFRASKARIELGFYQNGVFLTDLSSINQIAIGLKNASSLTGDFLSGPFATTPNGALTELEWNNGDSGKCHAAFDLTPSQTNVGSGAFTAQLVVYTVDSSSVSNPLASIKTNLYEAGASGSPSAGNLVVYNESAVRFALPFQLQGSDSLWYTLSIVTGDDGKPTLRIASTGQL